MNLVFIVYNNKMPSIILELIAGTALLGLLLGYKKEEKSSQIFGRFCVCYTKGDRNNFTYIPWISRTYATEEELNHEETELAKLAQDPEANSYFREQGFEGFAIIDLDDGHEFFWTRLQK